MQLQYEEFIASKQMTVGSHGIEVDADEVHPLLKPFQRDIVLWAVRKGRAAVFADTGLGKALPVDSLVMTPNGYRKMGDLVVGDFVTGSNGKATKVMGVYPQGERDCYRVSFTDGTSALCDYDHLWPVRTKVQKYRKQDFTPMTLREIDEFNLTSQQGWRFFIPMVSPIEFNPVSLPIDPYLLGVLIGDGCLTQSPCVSSADDDLLCKVAESIPDGLKLLKNTTGYDWRITSGRKGGNQTNELTFALRDLGLMGTKSETKFIPDKYKFAHLNARIAMLQGLLDTDGHVRPSDNNIEFCTVSECLANDMAFLVQSLGGIARIRTKKTTGQLAYRMSIILPASIAPFWLPRKADVYHPRQKYQPTRAIVSIEQVGTSEMVCIAVDAPDHCYVIEHGIVTHNTYIGLEWARLLGQRTLLVAPLSVARQIVRMAPAIGGLEVRYVRSQEQVTGDHLLWITNYEMIGQFDMSQFGAVVLDESSILKAIDGKTRRRLTEMCQPVPYRLCCTATPAPNDLVEIGNHAEFLGVNTAAEMRAMFFINANIDHYIEYSGMRVRRKGSNAGGQEWRLRHHGEEPFYKWMASWAMSIRRPSDLGYDDAGYILPPLTITPEWIDYTYTPDDRLAFTGFTGIKDFLSLLRKTVDIRCQRAAARVNADDEQWIVWTYLEEESTLAHSLIHDSIEVKGSDTPEHKAEMIEAFQDGKFRVLVTKPDIAGFGMNFQNARRQYWVTVRYSWEEWYQAIRRSYRFLQDRPVEIYAALTPQMQEVWDTIQAKEKVAAHMSEQLISHVRKFEIEQLHDGASEKKSYTASKTMRLPKWLKAAA